MHALRFSAAIAACLAFAGTVYAGDWLGGQYWGQIAGCADCGGSLYGCGCGWGLHKGDIGPVMTSEEIPDPMRVTPPMPLDEIVPDPPQARAGAATISRRVSYIEAVEPVEPQLNPRREQLRIVTHTSRPERLRREPIRIVSPDGSAGRMYR
jgi:hypothetical protein